MPPTAVEKGNGERGAQRAVSGRRPQRGGRKRTRDATSITPASLLVEPGDAPTDHALTMAASVAAPENDGVDHAPDHSSASATPAGRDSVSDPHSATSSFADGGEEDNINDDSDPSGLVRTITSPMFSSSDAAGHMTDEETAARVLQQSRGAAQSIQAQVESCVSRFKLMETRLDTLLKERQDAKPKLEEVAQSRHLERYMEVVSLNVGGERFTVPLSTLLSKDAPNYFHILLGAEETGWVAPVFKDEHDTIFIDRDPSCFKYIVDYLRGYHYFNLLKEDSLRRLKVDAAYYQLPGLLAMLGDVDRDAELQFSPGPGVSPERNRLRVVYGVAVVGDVSLVTGRHTITYEVKVADYVGFGLISESCVNTDQEFHKIPDCCVYYMSGVFYTNYPYHRKEENLERIENGDFVTVKVDLEKGYVEYVLKNSRKMVSLGRARRLRFATTMKLASRVRIVPPEEVRRRLSPIHYSFEE
ncbi:BTB/POZ domain containing protein [Leishmania donovani]|uniref:BTB/POZ domain family protein n=2 Tax=Leishmania donovani TaxID=5661 RepID=A0A504XGU0_LEIDO|nr:BTB/POZ domain family protein [Leishmania donovani]CAJ1993081.1 BTB/POZ domain containing protein [Leishmania donovani]